MKTTQFLSSRLSAGVLLALMGVAGGCAAQAPAASAAAPVVSEASAPGARVAFVNTDRIFSEANVAQAAQDQLKREFSGRERHLNSLGSTVKAAVDAFERDAPRMTEAQRAEQQRKVLAMEADFQQKRREFQEDLNNRKNEELQKLLDKANRIVIRIARQDHYDLILQEAVYVDKRLDITDRVIAELNRSP